MRGQYLTIEYVLFFTFGVILTVSIFFAFSGFASTLHDSSLTAQLEKTGEGLRAASVLLTETAKATGSNISYNISVPLRLSACTYSLVTEGKKLNVNCTDNYKLGAVLDLYGLPIETKGIIYSSKGYIEIKANATRTMLS